MSAVEGIHLATTYVHLEDGPAARPVPVRDFWQTIEQRKDLHGGRLVGHRGIVHTPGDTLHVTRGAGTQHRPV